MIQNNNRSPFLIGCAKGKFANGNGEVKDCAMGTYQDLEGQTSCQPCPSGTFGDNTGADKAGDCKPCPSNTYSSATGLDDVSKCNKCPAGRSSTTSGLTSATDCIGKSVFTLKYVVRNVQ